RRLEDAEKQHLIDSAKAANDRTDAALDSMAKARGTPSLTRTAPKRVYATVAEVPDYIPPIRTTSLFPDAANNLCVVPTTSLQARGGLLMDVVNTKVEIFERVQLPANTTIAGFGAHGVVFLRQYVAGAGWIIARTHVVRPSTKAQ